MAVISIRKCKVIKLTKLINATKIYDQQYWRKKMISKYSDFFLENVLFFGEMNRIKKNCKSSKRQTKKETPYIAIFSL